MIRHFSSGNWLCRKENFLFEFLFSWPLKEKYSWKLLFNQSTLPLYYISGYQTKQIHLKIINVKLFLKFDFLACEHFLLLKNTPLIFFHFGLHPTLYHRVQSCLKVWSILHSYREQSSVAPKQNVNIWFSAKRYPFKHLSR